MSGIRGDILDVTTPLVGGCAAPPFDLTEVERNLRKSEEEGWFGQSFPKIESVTMTALFIGSKRGKWQPIGQELRSNGLLDRLGRC
ncbi:hypothetical protein HanRHA438_Chr03g0103071 [Helianthus annuus]|nr:hypothetical protein HanRHA438_Chr03g0103071 [Helianthus annuus]